MVSQFRTVVDTVVTEAPRELIHRGASYVIICEGIFHTFASFKLAIAVGGILFMVVECWSLCLENRKAPAVTEEETTDAS